MTKRMIKKRLPALLLLFLPLLIAKGLRQKGNNLNPRPRARDNIDLGTLYDCRETKREGIYGFGRIAMCNKKSQERKTRWQGPKRFRAQVFRYEPTEAMLALYVCESFIVDLECYEKFFGSDQKNKALTELQANAGHCLKAVSSKTSPRGRKLVELYKGVYRTQPNLKYRCEWLSHTDERHFGYEYRTYEGTVTTEDSFIH